MKPNSFISYSRQCIGFVDDLAHRLEKQGFNVWLDYLSLIPGRPWLEQIHSGLEDAELLLLVVSPESISSRSVEVEWRHFLERQKRIILLIFQATPLPPELAGLEWVDFRGSYGSALKRLFQLIDSPTPMQKPAPQSGFKAPPVIWIAAAMSVVTAIYSLFAFWTILIPWVLLPLPARIFKRNFNFSQAQTALWTLPIALFFSFGLAIELGYINPDVDFDYNNYFSLYNFVLLFLFSHIFFVPINSLLMLVLLRLPAIQRWGKPEASVPKFANIYQPNIANPEPVHYYIDHAPEDRVIAKDLADALRKYGHTPADGIASADEVLVLISRFKSDTEADPETQVVYPILIQRVKMPEKLSQMQWIDFRKGMRNLDVIAQLLPQPAKMLAAVGVRPSSGTQGAMPNIVLVLVDFLIIMGVIDLGSFLSYMFELTSLNIRLVAYYESTFVIRTLFLLMICLALAGWLIYFMVRSLTERQGWFTNFWKIFLGFGTIFFLFTWQLVLGYDMNTLIARYGIPSDTIFWALPFMFYVLGSFLVGVAILFRFKTLRRWFPARVKSK